MIRRVLPHPWLTTLLTLVWLLLVNHFSTGNLILGLFLGVLVPALTEPYWPDRPRIARPAKLIEYVLIVMWDIIVANVVVAAIILFKRNRSMRPKWVSIPLRLKSPEAITILAGTITLTPGTVSADLSCHGHCLLVHCLDEADGEAVRDQIVNRYESRLLEVFE